MTLFELSVPIEQDSFECVRPFIYSCYPGIYETADYWTSIFGAPKESSNEVMFITSFYRDGVSRYSPVSTLSSCILTEQSFYWDNTEQKLYFHIEHDQLILGPVWQYGKVQGFSKERAIYIGDIFYSPIIESIPSLDQSQDLEAFDAMAFMSGAITLKNHNRDLDWMLSKKPFGYECALAYIEDTGADLYDRTSLSYLASYYVEDFSATLKQTTLNLQDRRKSQNIMIPTEVFTKEDYPDIEDSNINKPIPLLYGEVRALTPVLLNGTKKSGTVSYRVAHKLYSLGTVQVKRTVNDEDKWITVVPDSIDLESGSFVLSSAVGRDSNSSPYSVRVLYPNRYVPFIDEASNPVLPGAIETCRILMDDTMELWYTSAGGALYFVQATDALLKEFSSPVATDISACRFPVMFYNPVDEYYYLFTHIVDQGPIYVYNTWNGTTFAIRNNGQPIMERSSDLSSIYRNFWNPAVCLDEDEDTLHFVIECGAQGDQSDVGLGYSHVSLAALMNAETSGISVSFNDNLSTEHIISGGGNPDIKTVPDRDAILILAGNVNIEDSYWRIRAHYAPKDLDLAFASSWTKSPHFKIDHDAMHTTDPDFIETPGKTYGMLIGYMYNQSSSYQIYVDMTLNEFYDWIADGIGENPADIIKDLNDRYLSVQYTEEEYDDTEFEIEAALLRDVGILINTQVELYEAIRKLQEGGNLGFRYEFNHLGKRTIRMDDWDREASFRIRREDIGNIEDVQIETDSDLLAASIKLSYSKDYSGTMAKDDKEDEYLVVIDASLKSEVQLNYRQEPQLEFTSLLQYESEAVEAALIKEERYASARMIASLKVLGEDFLNLRIYDIVVVELVPVGYDADSAVIDGSKWVGVWRAIVLKVNPDASTQSNEISLALIRDLTDSVPLILDGENYLTDESGVPLVI